MKPVVILLCVVVFAACGHCAESKNQIQVQCQIFKFKGKLPGRTSAEEPIWTTDDIPERFKNKVTVFSDGRFKLGRDRLEFKDGNCFWNKKEIPITGPVTFKLPEDRIQLVHSPAISMLEHSKGSVEIQSKQPIQYFEKRSDGLFELKKVELATGMDIVIEAKEEASKGYIVLSDMVMTVRTIESRKKIEGVNLSVGYPVLGEQEYVFFFRVRPGKDYGILITPERSRGGLLIRLRASSTRSGTLPEKGRKK